MGEGKGWISIYRKIQDSWLWQEKPFDKAHAWVDLLLSANHKDNKVLFDGKLIDVKRGEFITSIRKLCDRWGWSNTKVKRFLDVLQNDHMVTYKSDTKKTTINIANYDTYQDVSDTKNSTETSQKRHRNITETSQKHTNNNENNDNNDNKYSYMSDSNEYRLAAYLFKFIKRNNPGAKEPNIQKWSKIFDYILRIDKRDIEEVKTLIKWCQDDSFWFKNILSPDKLRKQYDRLLLEMKKPQDKTHKQKNSTFNNFKPRDYDFKDLEKKLLGWEDK